MTSTNYGERMARLEEKTDNIEKKVDQGFADVKNNIKDLTLTVQQLVPTLVTQTQMTEKVTELDKEIVTLKTLLTNSSRRNSLQNWITSSLAAVFAVVLTILIQNYFR